MMRKQVLMRCLASGLLALAGGVFSAGLAVAQSATSASGTDVVASTVPEPTFSWGGYFEAIGIMLLLLGGLWLLLWAIRRYGKFSFLPSPGSLSRDALRMEAQLPLGPKKGLVVVRFLNERLLLGVTDQQISVLSSHLVRESNPAEGSSTASDNLVAHPASTPSGNAFADLLRETTEASGEASPRP